MDVTGSDGNTYSINPDDLTSMLTKNAQNRASAAGVAWNVVPEDANPARSYAAQAANQRADLQVNAVKATMVTTPYSDNSPFAPF